MFGRQSTTSVDERPADETVVDERDGTERIQTRPVGTFDERPAVDEPVDVDKPVSPAPDAVVDGPKRWAHVSFTATLSLVVGTLAIAATLTGLLAPIGFAGGVLAVLLALAGIVSVGRRHVTGHGLVMTGMLFGVIAVVLSLLAINGQLSWLSNNTNEITVVHNWLNDHMHWLRRW
jgi:hypothetical protein